MNIIHKDNIIKKSGLARGNSEMSQSSRDKVLWILSNSDGKMKRSDLRRRVSMRLADLEPILEELAKEGRIRTSGDMVSLNPAHPSRQNS